MIRIGTLLVISKLSHGCGEMVRRRNVGVTCFVGSYGEEANKGVGFVYRFQTTGTIEEKIFQRQ